MNIFAHFWSYRLIFMLFNEVLLGVLGKFVIVYTQILVYSPESYLNVSLVLQNLLPSYIFVKFGVFQVFQFLSKPDLAMS